MKQNLNTNKNISSKSSTYYQLLSKLGITIILAIVLINFTACNKPSTAIIPSGANTVKMRLDGTAYEVTGLYSNGTLKGIRKELKTNPRGFYALFGSTSISVNDLDSIGHIGSYLLMPVINEITKSITVDIKNIHGKRISFTNKINSGIVNITHNNSSFIAGTFSCTLYQDTTWLTSYDPSSPDSIKITDGYFDIAN
jgi:hypothetical protein